MDAYTYDLSDVKRYPGKAGALDDKGRLVVLPFEFWQQYTQIEISHFCSQHGLYCIPTTELVAWLKAEIGERKAIEIGSGNGVLAEALGIPATDSRMQENPFFTAYFAELKQAVVPYGENVRMLDGIDAVRTLKPDVVVAAWVTHKFRENEGWRKGNAFGVAEEYIVRRADYVFIGNRHVHQHKPILEMPHEEYEFPWLVSRSFSGQPNFIGVWKKTP
jgi:hypothetical protein